MLGAGDTDRDRQAELLANAPADLGGDFDGGAEEVGATGDIGKSLVDRDPLDQRREVAEDGDGGIAEPLIVGKMSANEDELRAELAGRRPAMPPLTPKALAS